MKLHYFLGYKPDTDDERVLCGQTKAQGAPDPTAVTCERCLRILLRPMDEIEQSRLNYRTIVHPDRLRTLVETDQERINALDEWMLRDQEAIDPTPVYFPTNHPLNHTAQRSLQAHLEEYGLHTTAN